MADPLAPHPLPQIEVDAASVASAFGLSLEAFREQMDSGGIRTLTERGVGSDLGHYRLSFWLGTRRFRMTTDADGHVLTREPG